MEKSNDISIQESNTSKKKKSGLIIVILLVLVALGVGGYFIYGKYFQKENNTIKETNTNMENKYSSEYKIESNGMENFDFSYLKTNDKKENIVYSPLSIKYALAMLNDAASGNTKEEIASLFGNYTPTKYINSNNASFANAIFVKDSYKSSVKKEYLDLLNSKYNAEVVFDDFNGASNINDWISDKTLDLIQNYLDDSDVKNLDFALINALAIDMEWVNKLSRSISVYYRHMDYSYSINSVDDDNYQKLSFNDTGDVAAIAIASVINKYDIINALGEDNIRKTVSDAWDEYYAKEENAFEYENLNYTKEEYLDKYIDSISENYKQEETSTDFRYYVDDDVKLFAKDLKAYDDINLEYVAFMPKNTDLKNFINDNDSHKLSDLMSKLIKPGFDTAKDGFVTEITGNIPMFDYSYDLNLKEHLQSLGVKSIFTDKAELSELGKQAKITDTKHFAKIEFSNLGIKAAATSILGGKGSTESGFDYKFEIPVEKINLTFDKPFIYIIRDKETGEVWFTGTVYEPCEYESYNSSHIQIPY